MIKETEVANQLGVSRDKLMKWRKSHLERGENAAWEFYPFKGVFYTQEGREAICRAFNVSTESLPEQSPEPETQGSDKLFAPEPEDEVLTGRVMRLMINPRMVDVTIPSTGERGILNVPTRFAKHVRQKGKRVFVRKVSQQDNGRWIFQYVTAR